MAQGFIVGLMFGIIIGMVLTATLFLFSPLKEGKQE